MAHRHGSCFCHHCKSQVLTVQTKPAHLFHGFVCFLGLFIWPLLFWLIAWIIAGVRRRKPLCSRCGADVVRLANAFERGERRKRRRAAWAWLFSKARALCSHPAAPTENRVQQHAQHVNRAPRASRIVNREAIGPHAATARRI